MTNTVFDRTFRDSQGTVVIAQPPNPPLWTWLIATLLKLVAPPGVIQSGLEAIAFGALFTWAWLELFDGVNYFRRALGAIVLLFIIFMKAQP